MSCFGVVAYLLIERSTGTKLLREFGTLEEAEKAKAELVAKDRNYEDVLMILWGIGENERPAADPDSP